MNFCSFLFALSCCLLFASVGGLYTFQANVDNDPKYNIWNVGNTNTTVLMMECNKLGQTCKGFSTLGYLKSSVGGLQATQTTSMWIKTDAPPLVPLPNLLPLPQSYSFGNTTIQVSSKLAFKANITSAILNSAIARYQSLIFGEHINDEEDFILKERAATLLTTLTINVGTNDETLQVSTDESYSLSISATASTGTLTAKTVYGVMKGLETFSQLIKYNFDSGMFQLKFAPWTIKDAPRFAHRGLLIDTSRHFEPLSTIRKVIDSLSYAKMNVLHWHIVDTQSFPVESKLYPKLWEGSWSPHERYTQQNLKDIVQYAKERGVRVMVEFDGPGHAWSWGVGYPQLWPANFEEAEDCEDTCPTNPCDVPLDPSNPFTYEVLNGLFSEMTGGKQGAGIFTEDLFHLGGDEVESNCWTASPQIAKFMKEHNYTSLTDLYKYFVSQTSAMILKYGRVPVHWEEVWNEFGTSLDKSTIIQVWLSAKTVASITAAGYRAILSNDPTWYLDSLNTDWTIMYQNDPLQYTNTSAQQSLVLGGECCMWGETVDTTDIFQRVWPRAAAVAERLWSYNVASQPNAIELAVPRLHNFRCSLVDRGIGAAPLYSYVPNEPSSCYYS